MKKPKILISGSKKFQNYIDAVEGCGGIAYASYLPEVDLSYDGLILSGGCDMDPAYYGEEIDGSVNIDRARDEAEFLLLKAFTEAGKPILGICRGLQIMNVFFGGSLYQDIKNASEHSSNADYDLVHKVTAVEGSITNRLYGDSFVVNSYHHQAIKKLGNDLKITMMSDDHTVVEAFEHETFPVFAVQWHPERMSFSKRRDDTVDGTKIFEYFINLCKNQMK